MWKYIPGVARPIANSMCIIFISLYNKVTTHVPIQRCITSLHSLDYGVLSTNITILIHNT